MTITVPASIVERIDRLADLNGQSRSYVIRRALEEWIPKHEHLARTMTDPFLGGLRRRLFNMIAEATQDPERAREVAEVLNSYEKKSEEIKAQKKKAPRHAQG